GAHDPYVGEVLSEKVEQMSRAGMTYLTVAVFDDNFYESRERWKVTLRPFRNFVVVETVDIVPQHHLQQRVVGMRRLDDDTSGHIATACSSAHLCDELECAFVRTKIREVHHPVCVENAHHPDFIEVETFRHHLCPDQNVRIALFKIFQDGFVTLLGARRVQVHALNMCFGKVDLQLFFEFFRPVPYSLQSR